MTAHDLEALLVERRKEHAATRAILDAMEKKIKIMCATIDALQPFTAQQIAYDADEKAISVAFPGASLRPFCIRSFSDLVTFISNPASDRVTGPEAPTAWAAMNSNEKASVTERAHAIRCKFPYLLCSIAALKDCYDRKLERAVVSHRAAIENFQDDLGIVESLTCVHHFMYSGEAVAVLRSISETGSCFSLNEIDCSNYTWWTLLYHVLKWFSTNYFNKNLQFVTLHATRTPFMSEELNMSNSQPGECVAHQPSVSCRADKVTSGTLILVELATGIRLWGWKVADLGQLVHRYTSHYFRCAKSLVFTRNVTAQKG